MKKIFLIGLLAAILMIPTIATADRLAVPSPTREVTGEIEENAPINWTNLWYETVTPKRCFNTANVFGIVPAGTYVDAALQFLRGIPFPAAKAVHINIAAFNAFGPGNLRAFAYGDPLPGTSALNYGSIPGLFAIGNASIIPLCGQLSCSYDITFYNSQTCNYTVDVMGFFF